MSTIQQFAVKGDLSGVMGCIKQGVHVNSQDSYGEAALHECARHGKEYVAAYLLRQGADTKIAAHKNNGWQPLHIAGKYGKAPVVELLVACGAPLNAKDNNGDTALILAAKAGDAGEAAAERLLYLGADYNIKDRTEKTAAQHNPKLLAIINKIVRASGEPVQGTIQENGAKGNLDAVIKMVKEGESINAADSYGETALHEAARHGHNLVSAFALSIGADVSVQAPKNNNWQPVHIAAKYGKPDVLLQLIARKADLNATDTGGSTPLAHAQKASHASCIQICQMFSGAGSPSSASSGGSATASPAPVSPAAASVAPVTPGAEALAAISGLYTPCTFDFDEAASKPLELVGGKKKIQQAGATTQHNGLAFGNRSFSSGKHSWVVKIEFAQGIYLDIGVTAECSQRSNPLFGLHGAGSTILLQHGHDSKRSSKPCVWPSFRTGMEVQVLLDMDKRSLSFIVNKQALVEDAVTGLPGTVFPAVHLREDKHSVSIM